MRKLWGGAFHEPADQLVERFTQSAGQDMRFWQEDLLGAVAHARMLGHVGLISEAESHKLIDGLERMHEEGPDKLPKDAEDIHTAIEIRLRELVGDVADKLAIGRSRNDQVATSARLYLFNELLIVLDLIKKVQGVLLDSARRHRKALMPGYTHFQPAQPVTLGFYLLAHFWALQRDGWRAEMLSEGANYSPLGAGALAGTSFKISRSMSAAELGFAEPIPNALDSVSDRSFVLDGLHACASIMISLSRLSQELVLFSNPSLGFVKLGDNVTMGSILLPQKRNPDVAELIRGRTAQSIGNWTAFAATLKALPLGYNRDLQDDKPTLYRSLDLAKDSLRLTAMMLESAEWDTRAMARAAELGGSTALDFAEELTLKGMSFRDAHAKVGVVLGATDGKAKKVADLPTARESVNRRASSGGPGPKAMADQIRRAQKLLGKPTFSSPV